MDMPSLPEFETITDDQLLASVRMLVARSNRALAELLAHLAEVETRGIHRQRACASLYTYCLYELRMSEDAAHRRSKAARLVRQFPELFARIAGGELHLTGLLLLGPHLDCDHRGEILDLARFRSKREIQELVSRLDPKPRVPAVVEPIGTGPAGRASYPRLAEALAPAVRSLAVGERPADWTEEESAPAPTEDARRYWSADEDVRPDAVPTETRGKADEAPSSDPWQRPMQFKVQFTASQEYVDCMNEALDLLSHELGTRDIAEVHARAMQALVAELRKRKCAATERARANTTPDADDASGDADEATRNRHEEDTTRNRHVPAEVRRQVWTRDAARCCYVDDEGRRCLERARLEIHHRVPFANGGSHAAENLELRCRAHNDLAAEQDFGREHMASMRGELSTAGPRQRGSNRGAGRIMAGWRASVPDPSALPARE
jgi:hypothetical protein